MNPHDAHDPTTAPASDARRREAAYRLADALLAAPEPAFPGPARPAAPYAYEVTSDGQRVRLEAPTAEGLANLIRLHDDANEKANV